MCISLLSLTLASVAENLALDEALLEDAEQDEGPEVLRLWESPRPAVVLGVASRVQEEVNVPACREAGVPVVRRCSGGAGVVIGPGCLMYTVVLDLRCRPELRMVDRAHAGVLGRLARGLQTLVPGVRHDGISDLALSGRKVSGNSLRCKRNHLLYHGTILYDFPLPTIAAWLRSPPRQPEYRRGRGHLEFVDNLPATRPALEEAIAAEWQATMPYAAWPKDRMHRLAAVKYSTRQWNEAR